MIGWRKTIPAVIVALALAAAVQADMVPSDYTALLPSGSASAGTQAAVPVAPAPDPLIDARPIDLDSLSFAYLPEGDADGEQGAAASQPVRLLANDRGSLELCLYALMGLGLCKTAPWVKKLSVGAVPDWYHLGAPYQIGGSHVVGPDCLCSTAVCFVQPDRPADDASPCYLQGTIASLLRHSQFAPTVLVPRGPPPLS